jgi:hypothetical protein
MFMKFRTGFLLLIFFVLTGQCVFSGETNLSYSGRTASDIVNLAKQGDAAALNEFGERLFTGEGMPPNAPEAGKWFYKAAKLGNKDAQFNLAFMYFGGWGMRDNKTKAAFWYGKAMEKSKTGDHLGLFRRWQKAAEQGDKEMQYKLGESYEEGEGLWQDNAESKKWFQLAAKGYCKAAEQGDKDAQLRLGDMYYFGKGIERDYAETVKWWQMAAEQGCYEAHHDLGEMYRDGKGVIQNDIRACCHYLIADTLGQRAIDHMFDFLQPNDSGTSPSEASSDAEQLHLSRSDYAEARRMAEEWLEQFRKKQKKDGKTCGDSTVIGTTPKLLGTGSGFVLTDDGYFFTCAHVVHDGGLFKVSLGNSVYPAKLVAADAVNDVALLKLDGKVFQPIPLRQGLPEMGDKVFTIGFPVPEIQGATAKYTDGAISSLTGIQDDIRTIQISVPVQPGNSGGPLADEAGNVVGIVVAKLNAATVFNYTGDIPQNVNFAVKIGYALPLIQNVPGLFKRLPSVREAKKDAKTASMVEKSTGMVLVYK